MYGQRFIQQFPAAGEVIIFDRSWYNRAGVERVLGYASEDQVQQFLRAVRSVNRSLPDRLRLRVIAADPPLDWARVQSAEDFRSILGKRAEFGADVIEREALRKRQKALLVFCMLGL